MNQTDDIRTNSPQLVEVSEEKLLYEGLLNRYTVIGNLSRNLAFMRVTLLVQNIDSSYRQRVSLDLFDTPTLTRIATEVAAGFRQHPPEVEAEFLNLSDLLESHRDRNLPVWKRKIRLVYPIQTSLYKQHLDDFRMLLSVQGYQNALYLIRPCESFLYYMESQGVTTIEQILPQHVLSYRERLTEQSNSRIAGGLGESHIREHLFVLRLFFNHLMQAGVLSHSPVIVLRQKNEPKPEPPIFSEDEIKCLYDACQTQFEKALLGLCYGCGLRRLEALTLTIQDIDFEQGILTVRAGKFNKTRSIPIADNVLDDLNAYIQGERRACVMKKKSTSQAVLLNSRGKVFSKSQLMFRFKQLVSRSTHPYTQFKEASLQGLRRSISTHLLNTGADFEFVQHFLGHVMLDTTHLYSRKRRLKEYFLKEAFGYGRYPKTVNSNNSYE